MFRTIIDIPPSENTINHRSKIVTMGSCFAQVIGNRFVENKFDCLSNPFGTIFNPVSIFHLLKQALDNDVEKILNPVERNGTWFNFNSHSDLYGITKEELTHKCIQKTHLVNDFLKNTDTLIITLGTAFVYRLKSTGELVANCHKIPATEFEKELLTVNDIITSFEKFYKYFSISNPTCQIVLTVSPVRHTKDTLPLNAVSKSVLRLACHELSLKHKVINYFPAYEILLDDLRDYRFYKEDMIHPSEVAENYIWDKFAAAYFTSETQTLINDWSKINKAIHHKPFRKGSEEYKKFIVDTLSKVERFKNRLPVDEEILFLKKLLNEI
jgi:hypothetical protein